MPAVSSPSTPAPKPGRGGAARPKHVPQRMCVACRDHDAKRGLVRVVRRPDGTVGLDPGGRANGRGAYLCHRPACWERALKAGLLVRALHLSTELDAAAVAELRDFAATLPRPEPGAAATGGGPHA